MVSGEQHHHRHMARARNWGLFNSQGDKKLSVADVQTVA